MSVHKTAYDTTACAGFVMRKTIEALQQAHISGQLSSVEGTPVRVVEGGSSVANAVPAFAHPILFDDSHKQAVMALDVRDFGRWVPERHEFVVRNDIEYRLATARAKLNWIWVTHSPSLLRDVSQLPLQIFATWVSEAVARRFALDAGEQYQVAIYAGIWYLSNFVTGLNFEEADKIRVATQVSRALRVKAEDVFKVLDEQDSVAITTSAHFCNLVASVSVRLQGLNAGVLFAIMGSTWQGTNGKEMVAVALEHPPTWIAILLAAGNERTYHHSGIAKILERSSFRDGAKTLQAAVVNLMKIIGASGGNAIAPL